MTGSSETRPAPVRRASGATQAGEARPCEWRWVERSVWTDRMLEALEHGVKGDVWFSLIDKVWREETLRLAFERVKANKGAAGADHQSIAAFEARLEKELGQLREELRTGRYRPRPIRRVWIEKPGTTEKRPLGIPAVRDRVVQAALVLVIEPIFEREFVEHSYGFRPERGAKDALRRVDDLLKAGYTWVVDADLKGYFDSIRQDLLMADVRERIADGRLLDLVRAFLEQPIIDGLESWTPTRGTPQGAVLSPLLANVFLHPVDVAMSEAGYEMVRYADDFVILCRSREEAVRAMAMVRRLCEDRGLTLHPQKTRIVNEQEPGDGFKLHGGTGGFDFLGYHFQRGRRWPCEKSFKRLKEALRRKTRRCNGRSLGVIIADCNRTLRGWFEYFKHSHEWTFETIDRWMRRRLRSILRKRTKRRGVSRGLDHHRWPNVFFRARGLYSLEAALRACLQSARG